MQGGGMEHKMTVKGMKTNEDKTVELEITVSKEEFGAAVNAAFKKNAKKIQVPGFRRGKAPRKMIEKLYGEGVFYEEAVNNTYPAAYEAAVAEKELDIVGRASIDIDGEVTADGYTFKATVAVKPEVELNDYKGLEAEKSIHEVTEDEINQEIERLRDQAGRMVSVEDRVSQDGDTAVIDFEGFVDDVPFAGGKGEDYPLVLGSNKFIPGFEEQVVGKKLDEEFDVKVTFPENYHAEELKGKPALFKCKLKELRCKELPALDDEFAKDVSEFETLAELREDVKKKLQEKNDEEAQNNVENSLMETVCGNMKVDIPRCMFDERIDEMVREFELRLRSQGMDLPTYLKYAGMELDAFRKTYEASAQEQVRTKLALQKIVELEKIEPTEEDVEKQYEELSHSYGMDVAKVKQLLSVETLKENIAMGKALDLVRDSAVVKEVKEKKPRKPRAKKVKEENESAEESAE